MTKEVENFIDQMEKFPRERILVFCRSKSSASAAHQLCLLGIKTREQLHSFNRILSHYDPPRWLWLSKFIGCVQWSLWRLIHWRIP